MFFVKEELREFYCLFILVILEFIPLGLVNYSWVSHLLEDSFTDMNTFGTYCHLNLDVPRT